MLDVSKDIHSLREFKLNCVQFLQRGLPPGHLYLVDGDPGTGKTTLGLQFLREGVAQNEPVSYITLSESERELRRGARSHGWDLEGISVFELLPMEESLKTTNSTPFCIPAK